MRKRQRQVSNSALFTKGQVPKDLADFVDVRDGGEDGDEDGRPAKPAKGTRRRNSDPSESESEEDDFLGDDGDEASSKEDADIQHALQLSMGDAEGIDIDELQKRRLSHFFSKAKAVPLRLQRDKLSTRPESAARAASYARLTALLKANGLKERKVRGDGNCQFRALADQLYGQEEHYGLLRQQAIQQMETSREDYCNFVLGSFDRYLARMRRSTTWGDHVTLQAAADALGVEVHLLSDYLTDSYIQVIPRVSKSSKVLRLCFWSEFHYNSVE